MSKVQLRQQFSQPIEWESVDAKSASTAASADSAPDRYEKCGICDDEEATVQCKECLLNICKSCDIGLHRPSKMASHKRTLIGTRAAAKESEEERKKILIEPTKESASAKSSRIKSVTLTAPSESDFPFATTSSSSTSARPASASHAALTSAQLIPQLLNDIQATQLDTDLPGFHRNLTFLHYLLVHTPVAYMKLTFESLRQILTSTSEFFAIKQQNEQAKQRIFSLFLTCALELTRIVMVDLCQLDGTEYRAQIAQLADTVRPLMDIVSSGETKFAQFAGQTHLISAIPYIFRKPRLHVLTSHLPTISQSMRDLFNPRLRNTVIPTYTNEYIKSQSKEVDTILLTSMCYCDARTMTLDSILQAMIVPQPTHSAWEERTVTIAHATLVGRLLLELARNDGTRRGEDFSFAKRAFLSKLILRWKEIGSSESSLENEIRQHGFGQRIKQERFKTCIGFLNGTQFPHYLMNDDTKQKVFVLIDLIECHGISETAERVTARFDLATLEVFGDCILERLTSDHGAPFDAIVARYTNTPSGASSPLVRYVDEAWMRHRGDMLEEIQMRMDSTHPQAMHIRLKRFASEFTTFKSQLINDLNEFFNASPVEQTAIIQRAKQTPYIAPLTPMQRFHAELRTQYLHLPELYPYSYQEARCEAASRGRPLFVYILKKDSTPLALEALKICTNNHQSSIRARLDEKFITWIVQEESQDGREFVEVSKVNSNSLANFYIAHGTQVQAYPAASDNEAELDAILKQEWKDGVVIIDEEMKKKIEWIQSGKGKATKETWMQMMEEANAPLKPFSDTVVALANDSNDSDKSINQSEAPSKPHDPNFVSIGVCVISLKPLGKLTGIDDSFPIISSLNDEVGTLTVKILATEDGEPAQELSNSGDLVGKHVSFSLTLASAHLTEQSYWNLFVRWQHALTLGDQCRTKMLVDQQTKEPSWKHTQEYDIEKVSEEFKLNLWRQPLELEVCGYTNKPSTTSDYDVEVVKLKVDGEEKGDEGDGENAEMMSPIAAPSPKEDDVDEDEDAEAEEEEEEEVKDELKKPKQPDASDSQPELVAAGGPAIDDRPTGDDKLSHGKYAEKLAEVLCSPRTQPPITVGVYAQWGGGKSFFLDKLKTFLLSKLEKQNAIWQANMDEEECRQEEFRCQEEENKVEVALEEMKDKNRPRPSFYRRSLINKDQLHAKRLRAEYEKKWEWLLTRRQFSHMTSEEMQQKMYEEHKETGGGEEEEEDMDESAELMQQRKTMSCWKRFFTRFSAGENDEPTLDSDEPTGRDLACNSATTAHLLSRTKRPIKRLSCCIRFLKWFGVQYNVLKACLRIWKKMPRVNRESDSMKSLPVKMKFIEFNSWLYSGSDCLWAAFASHLFEQTEEHFGSLTTRIYRARYNDAFGKVSKTFFITVVIIFSLIIAAGICVWKRIGPFAESDGEDTSDIRTKAFAGLGSAFAFAFLGLLASSRDVISNLIRSQADEVLRTMDRPDFSSRMGFMNSIKTEIDIISSLMRHGEWYDETTGDEYRSQFVIFIDDLDRCPADKVVEVLKALVLLFSSPNAPFIAVLAIDPRLIVQAIETVHAIGGHNRGAQGPGGSAEAMVNGYEYLDKIVQLPFCFPDLQATDKHRLLNSFLPIDQNMKEAVAQNDYREVSTLILKSLLGDPQTHRKELIDHIEYQLKEWREISVPPCIQEAEKSYINPLNEVEKKEFNKFMKMKEKQKKKSAAGSLIGSSDHLTSIFSILINLATSSQSRFSVTDHMKSQPTLEWSRILTKAKDHLRGILDQTTALYKDEYHLEKSKLIANWKNEKNRARRYAEKVKIQQQQKEMSENEISSSSQNHDEPVGTGDDSNLTELRATFTSRLSPTTLTAIETVRQHHSTSIPISDSAVTAGCIPMIFELWNKIGKRLIKVEDGSDDARKREQDKHPYQIIRVADDEIKSHLLNAILDIKSFDLECVLHKDLMGQRYEESVVPILELFAEKLREVQECTQLLVGGNLHDIIVELLPQLVDVMQKCMREAMSLDIAGWMERNMEAAALEAERSENEQAHILRAHSVPDAHLEQEEKEEKKELSMKEKKKQWRQKMMDMVASPARVGDPLDGPSYNDPAQSPMPPSLIVKKINRLDSDQEHPFAVPEEGEEEKDGSGQTASPSLSKSPSRQTSLTLHTPGIETEAKRKRDAFNSVPLPTRPILPRQLIVDYGITAHPEFSGAWLDLQGQGVANDYARFVWPSSAHEKPFLSVALAGSWNQYTPDKMFVWDKTTQIVRVMTERLKNLSPVIQDHHYYMGSGGRWVAHSPNRAATFVRTVHDTEFPLESPYPSIARGGLEMHTERDFVTRIRDKLDWNASKGDVLELGPKHPTRSLIGTTWWNSLDKSYYSFQVKQQLVGSSGAMAGFSGRQEIETIVCRKLFTKVGEEIFYTVLFDVKSCKMFMIREHCLDQVVQLSALKKGGLSGLTFATYAAAMESTADTVSTGTENLLTGHIQPHGEVITFRCTQSVAQDRVSMKPPHSVWFIIGAVPHCSHVTPMMAQVRDTEYGRSEVEISKVSTTPQQQNNNFSHMSLMPAPFTTLTAIHEVKDFLHSSSLTIVHGMPMEIWISSAYSYSSCTDAKGVPVDAPADASFVLPDYTYTLTVSLLSADDLLLDQRVLHGVSFPASTPSGYPDLEPWRHVSCVFRDHERRSPDIPIAKIRWVESFTRSCTRVYQRGIIVQPGTIGYDMRPRTRDELFSTALDNLRTMTNSKGSSRRLNTIRGWDQIFSYLLRTRMLPHYRQPGWTHGQNSNSAFQNEPRMPKSIIDDWIPPAELISIYYSLLPQWHDLECWLAKVPQLQSPAYKLRVYRMEDYDLSSLTPLNGNPPSRNHLLENMDKMFFQKYKGLMNSIVHQLILWMTRGISDSSYLSAAINMGAVKIIDEPETLVKLQHLMPLSVPNASNTSSEHLRKRGILPLFCSTGIAHLANMYLIVSSEMPLFDLFSEIILVGSDSLPVKDALDMHTLLLQYPSIRMFEQHEGKGSSVFRQFNDAFVSWRDRTTKLQAVFTVWNEFGGDPQELKQITMDNLPRKLEKLLLSEEPKHDSTAQLEFWRECETHPQLSLFSSMNDFLFRKVRAFEAELEKKEEQEENARASFSLRPTEIHAIGVAAPFLDGNPRRIKRIMNIYNVSRLLVERKRHGRQYKEVCEHSFCSVFNADRMKNNGGRASHAVIQAHEFNPLSNEMSLHSVFHPPRLSYSLVCPGLFRFILLLEQWPYRTAWLLHIISQSGKKWKHVQEAIERVQKGKEEGKEKEERKEKRKKEKEKEERKKQRKEKKKHKKGHGDDSGDEQDDSGNTSDSNNAKKGTNKKSSPISDTPLAIDTIPVDAAMACGMFPPSMSLLELYRYVQPLIYGHRQPRNYEATALDANSRKAVGATQQLQRLQHHHRTESAQPKSKFRTLQNVMKAANAFRTLDEDEDLHQELVTSPLRPSSALVTQAAPLPQLDHHALTSPAFGVVNKSDFDNSVRRHVHDTEGLLAMDSDPDNFALFLALPLDETKEALDPYDLDLQVDDMMQSQDDREYEGSLEDESFQQLLAGITSPDVAAQISRHASRPGTAGVRGGGKMTLNASAAHTSLLSPSLMHICDIADLSYLAFNLNPALKRQVAILADLTAAYQPIETLLQQYVWKKYAAPHMQHPHPQPSKGVSRPVSARVNQPATTISPSTSNFAASSSSHTRAASTWSRSMSQFGTLKVQKPLDSSSTVLEEKTSEEQYSSHLSTLPPLSSPSFPMSPFSPVTSDAIKILPRPPSSQRVTAKRFQRVAPLQRAVN